MSDLELALATQRMNLQRRRQRMIQQKRDLLVSARSFCAKPSTLFSALLAGAVLRTLHQGLDRDQAQHARVARASSLLRHSVNTSIQLLLADAVVGCFTQSTRHGDSAQNESAIH